LTIRALRCTLGILSTRPTRESGEDLPLHRRALVTLVRHETKHLEQLRTVVYVVRTRGDGKACTAHLGVRNPGSVGSSAALRRHPVEFAPTVLRTPALEELLNVESPAHVSSSAAADRATAARYVPARIATSAPLRSLLTRELCYQLVTLRTHPG